MDSQYTLNDMSNEQRTEEKSVILLLTAPSHRVCEGTVCITPLVS